MKSLTKSFFGSCSDQLNQLIDTDPFNLISNPDKSDEADPVLMLIATPMSNCYSIFQINKSVTKAGPKAISVFHCSIRSLQKKFNFTQRFPLSSW